MRSCKEPVFRTCAVILKITWKKLPGSAEKSPFFGFDQSPRSYQFAGIVRRLGGGRLRPRNGTSQKKAPGEVCYRETTGLRGAASLEVRLLFMVKCPQGRASHGIASWNFPG